MNGYRVLGPDGTDWTPSTRGRLERSEREGIRWLARQLHVRIIYSQERAALYYALAGEVRFTRVQRVFAQREAAMWSKTARVMLGVE